MKEKREKERKEVWEKRDGEREMGKVTWEMIGGEREIGKVTWGTRDGKSDLGEGKAAKERWEK